MPWAKRSQAVGLKNIPEAMEAILIGQSRMQPKVAVLKPLSSDISIRSGGPFGAEGPIIMTGGAFRSIFAQIFHMSSRERKTSRRGPRAGWRPPLERLWRPCSWLSSFCCLN